jgi:signal transduction histidine kinase
VSTGSEQLALLVHEVRSPVAALAAVGQALSDGSMDVEARHRLFELAVAACLGIERLVRDLTVSSVVLEHVDVMRIVDDVAVAAALTSPIPIRVRGATPELVVHADPLRVRQALDNLVRNAVAVSPADGEVVIEVVPSAEVVRVAVSDTGPGIAEADRARIFEPGVRLDERQPGSGLGLAVARAIAEAHGGSLSVESTLGAGSTFRLELPLA